MNVINAVVAITIYIVMFFQGDKNACITSILYLSIMLSKDEIIKAIKEKP